MPAAPRSHRARPAARRAAAPVDRRRRRTAAVVGATVAAALVLVGGGTATASELTPSAAALPLAGSASPSSAGPAAVPAEPAGLPAAIEDPSPYLQQVSCDPRSTPGALALGGLLLATYPGTTYGIGRACGADGIASEHYEGRAVDWMTSVRDPAGAARAQAFLAWLLAPDAAGHAFANARRLGVMYVIWNDHIWGTYAASAGWRPYSSCATHPDPGWDTSCHRNHIHLSLSWSGASGRTSFWTGHVAPTDYGPCRPADLNWAPPWSGPNAVPCPAFGTVAARAGSSSVTASIVRYSGATVGPGSTGPVVAAVQGTVGVTADGQFGDVTGAAVAAFRAAHGLPAGRQVDAAVWRALLAAPPPVPTPTPTPAPAPAPGPGKGSVVPSTGPGPTGTPGGVTRPRLAYGATGTTVVAVQRALHVTPVSGWFGPVTRAAVVAFQTAHGLAPTGVVDAATWQALGV